jgi:hypothetical protein
MKIFQQKIPNNIKLIKRKSTHKIQKYTSKNQSLNIQHYTDEVRCMNNKS